MFSLLSIFPLVSPKASEKKLFHHSTESEKKLKAFSMAVEARHLSIFPPQLISNRDLMLHNQSNAYPNNYSHQIMSPFTTTMPEAALLPTFQQSLGCNSIQAQTSVMKAADSGLTHNLSAPRKRSRDSMNNIYQFPNTLTTAPQKNSSNDFPCFFGDDVSLQIQQNQLEIDCLIAQHTKKMRLELEEKQKQSARLLVSAIREGVAKAIRLKEEQMQRMVKSNLFLQEKLKNLYVENQLLRDMAQTNEAAAISLRSNLEIVLAQVSEDHLSGGGGRAGCQVEADEAESCCGSTDHGEEEVAERHKLAGEDTAAAGGGGRMCRKCGERESCVLVLPCRHLCLCTQCGSALVHNCPVCNCNMNATVHVNMSSC